VKVYLGVEVVVVMVWVAEDLLVEVVVAEVMEVLEADSVQAEEVLGWLKLHNE